MSVVNEFFVRSPEELDAVASHLLASYPQGRVFAFHGAMGAGKTTLIKIICQRLGAGDSVCSPTFTIINEYLASEGALLYHFDFYRLKNSREAFDTGASDILNSGNYCFIEWPEVAPEVLPDDAIHVTILLGEQEMERRILLGEALPAADG